MANGFKYGVVNIYNINNKTVTKNVSTIAIEKKTVTKAVTIEEREDKTSTKSATNKQGKKQRHHRLVKGVYERKMPVSRSISKKTII